MRTYVRDRPASRQRPLPPGDPASSTVDGRGPLESRTGPSPPQGRGNGGRHAGPAGSASRPVGRPLLRAIRASSSERRGSTEEARRRAVRQRARVSSRRSQGRATAPQPRNYTTCTSSSQDVGRVGSSKSKRRFANRQSGYLETRAQLPWGCTHGGYGHWPLRPVAQPMTLASCLAGLPGRRALRLSRRRGHGGGREAPAVVRGPREAADRAPPSVTPTPGPEHFEVVVPALRSSRSQSKAHSATP